MTGNHIVIFLCRTYLRNNCLSILLKDLKKLFDCECNEYFMCVGRLFLLLFQVKHEKKNTSAVRLLKYIQQNEKNSYRATKSILLTQKTRKFLSSYNKMHVGESQLSPITCVVQIKKNCLVVTHKMNCSMQTNGNSLFVKHKLWNLI